MHKVTNKILNVQVSGYGRIKIMMNTLDTQKNYLEYQLGKEWKNFNTNRLDMNEQNAQLQTYIEYKMYQCPNFGYADTQFQANTDSNNLKMPRPGWYQYF